MAQTTGLPAWLGLQRRGKVAERTLVCLLSTAVLLPHHALAVEPPTQDGATATSSRVSTEAERKEEARVRFDQGLVLYNEGDYRGALAEFQQALELTGHPLVRYNLGLVYAKLADSLAVVDALAPFAAADSNALSAEQTARARALYDEHLPRIGSIEVETNVAGATIRIDSVDVAKAPAPPQRVSAGHHVVSLHATGYEPRRVPVLVAGRSNRKVQVELMPLEQEYAQLAIETSVPEVDIYEGDELLGRTPLATSVAFTPGVHDLTFKRPGYREEARTVGLHPASRGKLVVPMEVDQASAQLAALSLEVSEDHALLWVDGRARTDFASGMRLPIGRHGLRVQRAGFHDLTRDVDLSAQGQTLQLTLLPTADYLADYESSANLQRTLGFVSGIAGLLIAGAGGGFLLWNQGPKDEAKADYDAYADMVERTVGVCNSDTCEFELNSRLDRLEDRRARDVWGIVGIGVGAAALGTGLLLLLTADDPDRYRPAGQSDSLAGLQVQFSPTGLSVRDAF